MGKVIAIIGVLLFIWVAYPHIAKGEWFAPTPVPPGYWGLAQAPEYESYARPAEGYGVYQFDFWHNPPTDGRSVTRGDFALKR